ncbi:hypothetical protein CRG98_035519 [Punica granatum]|uniref:Uncharacterized protein n=1 Tax=Punica granatum TaxID=22663 RepID=A0A2I0IJE2_PUNGR|nr:hypothetical protein CRG98_035519 [Punica granatum]
MNSVPSFSWESLCGKPMDQNGVLTAPIRRAQENEELNNWTTVPCYSTVVVDVCTRILISSRHACAKPIQRGLGVSTFPWTRDGRA